MAGKRLSIVGIGGTTAPGSSTEQALRCALNAAEAEGVDTVMFDGAALAALPHYAPGVVAGNATAEALVAAFRAADGLVISSPGYHGSISGLVKNAIDYAEETSRDGRVYFDDLPVGLIVTAHGWQATGSTLATLRSIVHALRGWPTPLGAALKVSAGMFKDGVCSDETSAKQLDIVGRQVATFARLRKQTPWATETGPNEPETE